MEAVEEVAVLEDRERIAATSRQGDPATLATGMMLQTTLPVTDQADGSNRIDAAVDELDVTIREIRSTIFALQAPERRGLRVSIFALIDGARETLGFSPECTWTARSARSCRRRWPSTCSPCSEDSVQRRPARGIACERDRRSGYGRRRPCDRQRHGSPDAARERSRAARPRPMRDHGWCPRGSALETGGPSWSGVPVRRELATLECDVHHETGVI
jgi:hypothetical protein